MQPYFYMKALLSPARPFITFPLLIANNSLVPHSYPSLVTHNLLSLRMILYNISVIVEDSSHDQVVQWLKSSLRKSPYETAFLKMIDSPHEGHTYCIQFQAVDHALIVKFQEDVVVELQTYLMNHHAEKAFIFESKMQYLPLE